MKAFISGSNGFIGSAVSRALGNMGYEVIALSRKDLYGPAETLAEKVSGPGLVVHLAGAPIIGRWTQKYKSEIYNSRIDTTRNLVNAMHLATNKPRTFICASAVGIYPGNGVFSESDTDFADNFLGKVCRDWEAEAAKTPAGTRVLNFRFGVVLGRKGGALPKLALPFKYFAGGRIASGRQMVSWIHIEDLVGIFRFVIENQYISGPINVTSPQTVSNSELAKTIAKVLNRPAIFPVPEFVLKLVFGKGAVVLTEGQAANPEKLLKAGYVFRFPALKDALIDLL